MRNVRVESERVSRYPLLDYQRLSRVKSNLCTRVIIKGEGFTNRGSALINGKRIVVKSNFSISVLNASLPRSFENQRSEFYHREDDTSRNLLIPRFL